LHHTIVSVRAVQARTYKVRSHEAKMVSGPSMRMDPFRAILHGYSSSIMVKHPGIPQ
jgi:hypothetical protein